MRKPSGQKPESEKLGVEPRDLKKRRMRIGQKTEKLRKQMVQERGIEIERLSFVKICKKMRLQRSERELEIEWLSFVKI